VVLLASSRLPKAVKRAIWVRPAFAAKAQTSGSEDYGENVNFYQLEDTVSTRVARKTGAHCAESARLRLIRLDQVADALGVGLAMAVAGNGVGASGGFDANLSPKHAR
jgi:hypothetical protein